MALQLSRPSARPPPHTPAPAPAPAAFEDIAAGFCAAGAGIVVTDTRLRILTANATYAAMTGLAPEDLRGRPLILGDGVAPPAVPKVPMTAPGSSVRCWEGELQQLHCSGRTHPTWVSIDAICDDRGKARRFVVTCTDISALKRQQDLLRHQAQHDPLTGLPHRALFDAELARAVAGARRHGRPFALLFIDVDHFKHVNDALGHAAGDQLLCALGRRLQQCVRGEDLVARIGGDEFAVLLQSVAQAADAGHVAEVMQAAIGRGIVAAGHRLQVSASIGVALFPDDAGTADGLLRAADAAMYRVKTAGRHGWARADDPSRAAAPG